MNCPKCNAPIPDGSKFCNECGSNISSASKQSGTEPVARDLSLGNLPTMGGTAPVLGRATAAQPPGVPLTDRYELMEELGRGGFAVVWKARDRKLDRIVAVKRLQIDMLQGHGAAQTLERFRREARAIAALNHRNIVAVYDCDHDVDGDYIVMEYIGGGSLRDHLKAHGGRLPVSEATRLARGMAEGLAYAHRKNLVHRDIKPANILLLPAENGELIPKILDFGLARIGSDSETSVSGYGLGTPYYMPPEQRRDAKNVNHTADIYALGKTLYEMVSGEIPDSVDPDKVPPPPELAQIIFKCVKAKPEERYFSADELVSALAAIVGGGPATSGAATSANACPACGRGNPVDARFCEGCGAGLCATCPECGRENTLQVKFCPSCGTDRTAFQALSETLARMERFRRESKWSRVIKEAELLPKGGRLPGEKGKAALAAVQAMEKDAATAQANKAKLKAAMADNEAAGRWNEALAALAKYAELAPDEAEAIAAHRQAYEEKRDAALLVSKADEYPALVAVVREALELGRLDVAASTLSRARKVLDSVKQDVEGAEEAATELQELEALLAARQAEQAAKAAAARRTQRRRMLWGAAAVCAMVTVMVLGFWGLQVMRFRGDIKAFEAAARADQVEGADALATALRAKYPPAAQWEQLQQARGEMVTARLEASAAGAPTAAKTAWDKAESEAAAARESAAQGLYAEATSRTTTARDAYRKSMDTPLVRYRQCLAQATKALDAKDWKTAESACQGALSETTVPDRQAAEDGLKNARVGNQLAAATAAKNSADWESVVTCANDILQLDAQNATAKQLLLDAQPVLTVRAFADGKELTGAIISIDGAEQKERTPAAWTLAKGSTYTFGVRVVGEFGGKNYGAFQTTYRVERAGPQELKAMLVEQKMRVPTGFRAAAGTAPEPYTQTGWAQEIVHDKTGITLVYIPAGTFTMGSPVTEPGREQDETQHQVTLSKGFYMGKCEVTHGQWKKLMATDLRAQVVKALKDDTIVDFGGGKKSTLRDFLGVTANADPASMLFNEDDTLPMHYVNWSESMEFCQKAGAGFRLPTEAEWEYACRAGSGAAIYTGSLTIKGVNNGPELDAIAWYGGNSSVGYQGRGSDTKDWTEKQYPGGSAGPRVVGLKKENAWGLNDMLGNVWEWCQEWYGAYPGGAVTDPTGAVSGSYRVFRGGSWFFVAWLCRAAYRFNFDPSYRNSYLGFRVVVAAPVQ